ncbi:MAG: hypothetical protein GF355_06700, partial [Candidatus Eisenbacteria bacterium]|nr:hypothetical protein [Candidatus Eisenbacteria bacterium]
MSPAAGKRTWRQRFAELGGMDRRIIFIFMFLSVALPLLFPVGFPIEPSKEVEGLFQAVEELPPGSIVYLAADLDPGSMPELYPMLEAGMRHMFRKDLRVVAASLWPAAPPLVEEVWRDVGVGEFGKEYGTDFVNLGFK